MFGTPPINPFRESKKHKKVSELEGTGIVMQPRGGTMSRKEGEDYPDAPSPLSANDNTALPEDSAGH